MRLKSNGRSYHVLYVGEIQVLVETSPQLTYDIRNSNTKAGFYYIYYPSVLLRRQP